MPNNWKLGTTDLHWRAFLKLTMLSLLPFPKQDRSTITITQLHLSYFTPLPVRLRRIFSAPQFRPMGNSPGAKTGILISIMNLLYQLPQQLRLKILLKPQRMNSAENAWSIYYSYCTFYFFDAGKIYWHLDAGILLRVVWGWGKDSMSRF